MYATKETVTAAELAKSHCDWCNISGTQATLEPLHDIDGMWQLCRCVDESACRVREQQNQVGTGAYYAAIDAQDPIGQALAAFDPTEV